MNKHPRRDPGELLRELERTALDDGIKTRLAGARQLATSRATQRPLNPGWMPAATFATAAGLALMLAVSGASNSVPPDVSNDAEAALFVYGETELELLEDIEFYHWLERQGHAG